MHDTTTYRFSRLADDFSRQYKRSWLRRSLRWLAMASIAAAAVGLWLWNEFHAKPATPLEQATAIEVTADPLEDFFRSEEKPDSSGPLIYRNGLVLHSSFTHFGGWSGLRVLPDGRLIMVSDSGNVLQATLVMADGQMHGLDHAVIAPLNGPDGIAMRKQGKGDVEALEVGTHAAYLGYEGRRNGVVRIDSADFGEGASVAMPVPQQLEFMPEGRGPEALAEFPAGPHRGALLVIAERPPGGGPVTPAWIFGAATGNATDSLMVRVRDGYDISDACFLPDGDLLLLERRISPTRGFSMRIRRIALDAIVPDGVLEGQVLIETDSLSARLDNMEGMTAFRDDRGDVLVALVSDNNFLPIQKTLLLLFQLT